MGFGPILAGLLSRSHLLQMLTISAKNLRRKTEEKKISKIAQVKSFNLLSWS